MKTTRVREVPGSRVPLAALLVAVLGLALVSAGLAAHLLCEMRCVVVPGDGVAAVTCWRSCW